MPEVTRKDVIMAIATLGERDPVPGCGVNLAGVNLTRINLSCLDLSWADLTGAKLRKANLKHTRLYGAHISNADFEDADLSYANLESALAKTCNFHGANLRCVNMHRIEAADGMFKLADMTRANLERGAFWRAFFVGSDLRGARFKAADLRNTTWNACEHVDPASFEDAKLEEAFSFNAPEGAFNIPFDPRTENAEAIDKHFREAMRKIYGETPPGKP